jgi:hypothetical protein
LDGTLAYTTPPLFDLGEPIPGAVEAMKKLDSDGWKLVIYTARHWSDYINIEDWLTKHGIPFREIICGKPLFRYMIDDKNIEFKGDWGQVLSKIPAKKPQITIHDPAEDNICDDCQ